jgi:class 3 adenylate cyclase
MAAGGIRQNNSIKAQDVVNAAKEMLVKVQELKNKRIEQGRPYFQIRIGISTGPVVAGVVGLKKFQYDIWGDTVNTAARMEQHSDAGKINVSESTYQLIKDYFTCIPREPMEVKGKGILNMYYVS